MRELVVYENARADRKGYTEQVARTFAGYLAKNGLRLTGQRRLILDRFLKTDHHLSQDEIYLTLRRQYELAKIEERRDVPVLRVLDAAAIPAFRISPRRKFMTAWGLLAGATLGAALVLTRSGGLSIKSTTIGQENG